MPKLLPFNYGNLSITEAVIIDDIPYLTRQSIGDWLEYEFPQQAIAKILERNPHIDAHSVVVRLTTTDGKNYDTNVYHPIGFLLIVMESGQPKAKEKKVEVAEFVWHFSNPGTERLTGKERRSISSRVTTLIGKLPNIKDALVFQETKSEIKSLCDKLGRAYPDYTLLGKVLHQASLELTDFWPMPLESADQYN